MCCWNEDRTFVVFGRLGRRHLKWVQLFSSLALYTNHGCVLIPIRFSADHRLRQMWERSRPGNENCSLDRVSVPMIFVSQRCIANE